MHGMNLALSVPALHMYDDLMSIDRRQANVKLLPKLQFGYSSAHLQKHLPLPTLSNSWRPDSVYKRNCNPSTQSASVIHLTS